MRGRNGWRNTFHPPSPEINEFERKESTTKFQTKFPALPFDSVILHVEPRQCTIGEESLKNIPEENSGRGSNKVPGIRECVERVIKSILDKHKKERNIDCGFGKSMSGEISSSKPLKTKGKIQSEPTLQKLSKLQPQQQIKPSTITKLPTVTMSTYAGALSRNQRKSSQLKSQLKNNIENNNNNKNQNNNKNNNNSSFYPYCFETSVGCLWEGTCFVAEYGELIR